MSKFVEVVECQYGGRLMLNIDNIVAIHKDSGVIYTNTVHGEGTGIFRFDAENMEKIINATE